MAPRPPGRSQRHPAAAVCVGDLGAGSSTKTVTGSTDGGRSWQVAGTAPRGGQLLGLAAPSPTTVVVAAASGASYLYRSVDGGVTWSTAYQDTVGGGALIEDLGFTDPQHGVAVLAAGPPQLLRSIDGGASWYQATLRE